MQESETISGQVVRTIAHEIRNPLTNINLSLNILEGELNGHDPRVLYSIIRRNCDIINTQITNLLVSFAIAPAYIGKYSINLVLDEVLEMANDRIVLRHVQVKKHYAPCDCTITLDKEKIKIALLNIIVNAIEAMPDGKGELMVATNVIDGKCMVTIEDNGTGISKEMLNNVFRPYFTNKSNGIGLGLAATHQILESHKATIEIESEENSHTRFIISFNVDK